jgi:hypothetical protein
VRAERLEELAARIRQGEQIILADLERVVIAPVRARRSGRRHADPREPGEEERQEPKNHH